MATILNPYISFRDTAAEAMEFYQSVTDKFGINWMVNALGEQNA